MQHLRSLIFFTLCLAAASKTIHVEVKNNETDQVCMIADLDATVSVTYETTANKTKTKVIPITQPEGPVPGVCTPMMVVLQLVFGDNFLGLVLSQAANTSYLSDATLNVTLPNDAKYTKFGANRLSKTLVMGDSSAYFECNSGITENFLLNTNNQSSSLTFKKLKIQAYNVKNNTYSNKKVVCDGDKKTTPAPPPTSSPKPTTPPTGHWSVKGDNDTVCVVLQMGAEFMIPYVTNSSQNATANITLPSSVAVTGKCGKTTDSIKLAFFNDWSLELIFAEVNTVNLAAANDYALENVTLNYVVDAARFKDVRTADLNKKKTAQGLNLGQFKTGLKNSFTCVAKTEISLSDGVKFDTFNLTAQAFKSDNKTIFVGGNQVCPADAHKTSSIVPIAVGIALAILVVIVLIAYIIGRRRSKSNYETV